MDQQGAYIAIYPMLLKTHDDGFVTYARVDGTAPRADATHTIIR